MSKRDCVVNNCDKRTKYLASVCQLHGGHMPHASQGYQQQLLERVRELEKELYSLKGEKQIGQTAVVKRIDQEAV